MRPRHTIAGGSRPVAQPAGNRARPHWMPSRLRRLTLVARGSAPKAARHARSRAAETDKAKVKGAGRHDRCGRERRPETDHPALGHQPELGALVDMVCRADQRRPRFARRWSSASALPTAPRPNAAAPLPSTPIVAALRRLVRREPLPSGSDLARHSKPRLTRWEGITRSRRMAGSRSGKPQGCAPGLSRMSERPGSGTWPVAPLDRLGRGALATSLPRLASLAHGRTGCPREERTGAGVISAMSRVRIVAAQSVEHRTRLDGLAAKVRKELRMKCRTGAASRLRTARPAAYPRRSARRASRL